MQIGQIERNISQGFGVSGFGLHILRYIDRNLIPVLEEMQRDQLFNKSVGADGIPLGYYSSNKQRAGKPVQRSAGEPFDMIFTGRLKNSIRVEIAEGSILFTADSKYTQRIRFDEIFGTSDWFGLTTENWRKLIDNYLLTSGQGFVRFGSSSVKGMVLNKIRTGSWTK